MGGSQTIVLPNGQRFEFNDKEYYSGRGSKYNHSIRHDTIGDVVVTLKEFKEALKYERERVKAIKVREREAKERNKRVKQAEKMGLYNISQNGYIELSEDESQRQYFDTERLARTLKISTEDASLLRSEGKTYVFAKTEDGRTLQLYHSDLSCNRLNIHVEEATAERIAEFDPEEWFSAPYAAEVGNSFKPNHFVC